MQGHHSEEQSVFIREVPGGCMCCASGLPMQIVLNQLLLIARPDRLLIEPTGLGHPKEVLQVLTSGAYREVLSVEQVITLVNARQLSDKRYTKAMGIAALAGVSGRTKYLDETLFSAS